MKSSLPLWFAPLIFGLLAAGSVLGQELQNSSRLVRPLAMYETRYRLGAGERTPIDAPAETLDFVRNANQRILTIDGSPAAGLVIGPGVTSGEVLLGASLNMQPGNYLVRFSATSLSGEQRAATLNVTVDPLPRVSSASPGVPVVLLDGWQLASPTSSCPMSNDSSGTFGLLRQFLFSAPVNVPQVYFFENCTQCPNCPLEQLAGDLGQFLNSIRYDTGAPVPQIDLIAHSMGGLIVRSYLAGQQTTPGMFSPPASTKVRKVVFIATPHFGSYVAANPLVASIFGAGNQTMEMMSASTYLWNLATWNQFGDDLRGADAIAIVGNAGTWNNLAQTTPLQQASDGVVSLTSASLGFAQPDAYTRIIPYCHIPLSSGVTANYLGCVGGGVAYIDGPAHPSLQIIQSFLTNTNTWQSIGHSPSQDPYLSLYGGIYFGLENAAGTRYINDLTSVVSGSVPLQNGGSAGTIFYNEFLGGTVAPLATSASLGTIACGSKQEPAGYYSIFRCKYQPAISSVTPLLPNVAGKIVPSGGSITVNGLGFGKQQCSNCGIAAYPGPSALQILSWSDQAITAALPASYTGFVTLAVTAAAGSDSINIIAASAPSISSGGVLNNASFAVGAPVSPGAIVAVFGNFPQVSATTTQAATWPTSLGGVSMKFGNGINAPLYYVSSTQVNLVVPWELAGQSQTTLAATVNGQASAAQTVSLAQFSPGIFAMNGQGTGQGAILDTSYRLVDSSNPAVAGATAIQIFCTGLGPVTNQPASGGAAPTDPLAVTTTVPTVTIGGVPAQVLFHGLAPGFVGLYQVNALVPAGVTASNSVPVVISIGGTTSNTVTIAVTQAAAP